MIASQGIHHITAIGSDPQKLVDFYTQILGLRLVKKTVNQDDVSAYHLFFGDKTGEPGMDLTFFTFANAQPGSRGRGLVTNVSLAVPSGSLQFWQERFTQFGVKQEGITTLFSLKRLVFYDFDDQRLELVEVEGLSDHGIWTTPQVSAERAIPFQRSVLEATARVPRGEVSTYAEIARRIGNPKAVRAVGQALRRNPIPIVVPCHRVIASDGSLGGYAGNLRDKRKIELLKLEGVYLT